MNFIIKNKKILIAIVALVILGTSYGVHNIIKNKDQNDISKTESANENNEPADTVNVEVKKEDPKIVTEYENQTYHYSVQFLQKWYMNNDDSESKMTKIDNGNDASLLAGGQTFWSNYANINKYSPKNKPDDFRLLALTVYKDESKTIDKFAQKIGANEFTKMQEIQAKNISGQEYIGSGLTEKNPRITVIFKKDDLFYVFKPAFMNGDENAAGIMEDIVRSFTVL